MTLPASVHIHPYVVDVVVLSNQKAKIKKAKPCIRDRVMNLKCIRNQVISTNFLTKPVDFVMHLTFRPFAFINLT